MTSTKNLARLLLAWQLVCGANVSLARGFASAESERTAVASHASQEDAEENAVRARRKGLRFRLSRAEGQPETAVPGGPKRARAERLSESETGKILARLPPLEAVDGDKKDFALRERSLPPPRTGKTINVSFPQSPDAPAPTVGAGAAAGALEVARFGPEGDAPLSAQVSVTFSQPVAAVTSQAELAAVDVPVKLSPQPAGRWRWVGTRTLLFEPEGRLPGATRFLASVPAGTRTAGGATLAAARSWTFQTPAPRVTATHPAGESRPRDALMFVAFDQKIDPAAVLRTVRVTGAAGGRPAALLRLATAAEVAADEAVRKLAAEAGEGRWLAFRAAGPLAGGAKVQVQIGPGTPSAEGPLTTTAAQSFTFKTFGSLSIREATCGYQKRCSPFDSFRITFTNPLDAEAFNASQVKIEPALPDADVQLHGRSIVVEGRKRRQTTYRVTLAAGLRDAHGQTLGSDIVLGFNVGTADPFLTSATDGILVVQDPHAAPRFSVYSVNHRALKFRLHAVGPGDWGQFVRHVRESNAGRNVSATEVPGRLVREATADVKAGEDAPVETQIDLAPALDGRVGHVVVTVEPAVRTRERGERVVVWVQVTNIGLDAFVDQKRLHGWATSLKDGSPLAGVALDIQPAGARAATGADGLASVELPAAGPAAKQSARGGAQEAGGPGVLVARLGKDVAMLPETFYPWSHGGGWQRREAGDALRWYVFDDRKMYRPGEEVHVKGWIRRVGTGTLGDVGAHAGGGSVGYTLSDARGNEITKGTLKVNALGGFDASFKLPPTMNLGHASLLLTTTADGVAAGAAQQHYHHFQVQEFRRPEFEVGAQTSEGPHNVGGHAETVVNASYFAGGGLADAPVAWRVTSRPASFTPPNRSDFTFGKWTPWWTSTPGDNETHTETFAGRTDAEGKHRLRIDFESVEPARASAVEAQASVTDVNRQQWTATTQLIVHPADLYVGLRSPRTFVREGEPLVVESIVVDLDGRAVAERAVEVRAVRLDWTYVKGQWQEREADAQTCEVRSRAEAVECRFVPKAGGRYRVTARVRDERERLNESELTLWVAGGQQAPAARGVEQGKAELIPDRREYAAGEVAEILVQSPFVPAEGVLSLRRSGLVRTERFRMNEPTHTLRVPIEEGHTPNVHVQVDLVGAAPRMDAEGKPQEKLPKRPAFASGELNLSVPPLKRKLTVSAAPRAGMLEPGGETTVDVGVKDAGGRAVAGGEVAVVVVDESVLALTGYKLDDPLSVFYSQREEGVSDHHLRERVQLADAEDLTIHTGGGAYHGGGGAAGMATLPVNGRGFSSLAKMSGTANETVMVVADDQIRAVPPPMATPAPQQDGDQSGIRLRQNFNALAVFAAAVPTDSQGRARVAVKVPDNLTRYRVMAVAVAGGTQFGAGESAITARSPLMVRPSAPRFLNFGDRVELPVVVQNQTDQPLDVSIAVRAANASLTDGAGRRLTVAANDRVEVRFPVAAEAAGTARFQVGAIAGRLSDAAEVSLPVWTPATSEAFAAYGEVDSGAIIQPVTAPANVLRQFGGLELTTSSTQLQELTDAYLYLSAYPYECAEQLSSRILAVAALKDVLAAFDVADAPTPAEARAAVARDIRRLQGMQNGDGGFGFWRRGERSWPFVTVHVAHALARAREKDFHVPPEMLEAVKGYLRAVEGRVPSNYPPAAKRAIAAYALNVRMRLGERDAARARKLVAEAGLANLSLEATGWLLPVVSGDAASTAETEAIRRHLLNRVSETAATAHFVTSYGEEGDYLVLHSARRADAVILESLIIDQPRSDLVAKLARGLLAHRKAGRWSSTQENVFVLLALDRYFRTYESAAPNFTARAWLGAAFAGEMKFAGRTTDRQQVSVPMSYLLDAAKSSPTQNLAVAKEGAGRLYYRVGISYAPANLKLDAADYGFTVERAYEAVDDPKDVRRDADGTWRIKSGARVRVRLTMHAPSRRYHVALVDPLPAGLESLNPALAVTGDVPEDGSEARPAPLTRGWWWNPRWFEHQNLRDERTEAFASLLSEGVHTYSYVARATTPGAFVVPPPKAEEMYHPETYGRGPTDRVVVED